jgi:hypothetical protein
MEPLGPDRGGDELDLVEDVHEFFETCGSEFILSSAN